MSIDHVSKLLQFLNGFYFLTYLRQLREEMLFRNVQNLIISNVRGLSKKIKCNILLIQIMHNLNVVIQNETG